jgi:hypothetical protein
MGEEVRAHGDGSMDDAGGSGSLRECHVPFYFNHRKVLMKIKSFSVIGKQVGVRLGAGEVLLVEGSLVIEGERGSYLLNYPGHKSIPDLMQAFRTDLMGIMDMTEDELASAVESTRILANLKNMDNL